MIVVFDSGVWVSAMEFDGTPREAVSRAIAQDRFAVCDQIEGCTGAQPIIENAQRAEAECIVTGDHDLLTLASYVGFAS